MVGDFNYIDSSQEKRGGRTFMDGAEAKEFREFIEKNDLVDLGFVRPRFTWCNNHHGGTRVWEMIDRTFAGADCIQIHHKHQVLHLSRIASDHRPILITMEAFLPHQRLFCFEKF